MSSGKTRSYKPNRRGGRAHGGGGNRSDDRSQGSNFNQPAMRGQSTRGRGQSRGRGGLQQANNVSQSASNTTRRPGLGGSSRGRKFGDIDFDEEDDEDDEDYEIDESDEDTHTEFSNDKEKEKPREKLKVEMQLLHMSNESQLMVQDMLRELHGDHYRIRESKSYRDSGNALGRFWLRDNQLKVQEVIDHQDPSVNSGQILSEKELVEQAANQFAIKELGKYGFHTTRCKAALDECNGDGNIALLKLMFDCFISQNESVDFKSCFGQTNEEVGDVEAIELMTDEKLALESIYAESFVERIPNKLWEMTLKLPHIEKHFSRPENDHTTTPKKPSNRSNTNRQDKSICRFFLSGHCRFGDKCRFKHEKPVENQPVQKKEDEKFLLEIRFPSSSARPSYPKSTPIICFSVPNSQFPASYSLKITSRLMEEAKMMADQEAPSVFTLVSLLEDEDEIDKAIRGAEVEFSFSSELVPNHVKNGESFNVVNKKLDLMNINGRNSSISKHRDSMYEQEVKDYQNKDFESENLKIKDFIKKRLEVPKLMKVRQQLPAWSERNKILSAIKSSQVVVISGMTGCGKSTQVPQFILDEWISDGNNASHCNIVCTQPRRISAIGVAERVADERAEKVGANKGLVGYQIRLESKTSSWTRLLFCTTGILLRRLESDPSLQGTTHLVIDEVHERSEQSDFLLMILRDLLPKRPELRVILMSATLNASLFANYLESKFPRGKLRVPIIDIPGRTFPVEQIFLEDILDITEYAMEENSPYARPIEEFTQTASSSSYNQKFTTTKSLKAVQDHVDEYDLAFINNDSLNCKQASDKQRDEQIAPQQVIQRYTGACSHEALKVLSLMDFKKIDYDLIEKVLCYIAEGDHEYPRTGSILVFLPGLGEIMTLHEQLLNHQMFGTRAGKFKLLPLHSSLTSEEQGAIFEKPKSSNIRKIILSTNLAETSITIDDCVFVVDAGRMKENRFDPTKNMESLDTVWVSKANALQRKGRAGRVMSGVCFHLYTKFRYDKHFRHDPTPEIQRVPLEQMILRIKILPIFGGPNDAKDILGNMIEPPEKVAIETAESRLQGVGALDSRGKLTPLGYHLAGLPVDVRIGKIILFGAIFRCLDSALTIAAALSYRSPFVAPFGKREEAQKKKIHFSQRNSDHISMLRAYQGWYTACQKGGRAGYVFAQENYLSVKTLQMLATMKHQFTELLSGIGFIGKDINVKRLERAARGSHTGSDGVLTVTGTDFNTNNNNYKVVVSVLASALYPHVVQILSPETKYMQTAGGAIVKPPSAEDLKFRTKEDGYVNIHPSSVNAKAAYYENAYMVFHEKIKTSRVFVRELSMVPIYPMVLFGGGDGIKVQLQRGKFVLSMEDGWIKFVTESHKVAECLKEMRSELDQLLEDKIREPTLDLTSNGRGKLVINTLVSLLSKE